MFTFLEVMIISQYIILKVSQKTKNGCFVVVVVVMRLSHEMFRTKVLVLVNDLVHICHCKQETNDKNRNQAGKNIFYESDVHIKVDSLFGEF